MALDAVERGLTVTVRHADGVAQATMSCDECGSISAIDPSLPYIKQTLAVRLWHLKHGDCRGSADGLGRRQGE